MNFAVVVIATVTSAAHGLLLERRSYALPEGDESSRILVSSRGLMKSCDVHPLGLVRSSAEQIDSEHYINAIRNASSTPIVYVNTCALPVFRERVLPYVTKPFVLVSGDADSGPNNGPNGGHHDPVLGKNFTEFVSSRLILKWFAQNAIDYHEKIVKMPVGLDYHSLLKPGVGGIGYMSTAEQETELFTVRAEAPPFEARSRSVFYGGLTIKSRGQKRRTALEGLANNSFEVAQKMEGFVNRTIYWREIAKHKFAASPQGRGVDCYRTYEILMLGGVPLVTAGPHNALFKDNGLPILEVADDEWGVLDNLMERAQNLSLPKNFRQVPHRHQKQSTSIEYDPRDLALKVKQLTDIEIQMKVSRMVKQLKSIDMQMKAKDVLPALTLKYWVSRFRQAALAVM